MNNRIDQINKQDNPLQLSKLDSITKKQIEAGHNDILHFNDKCLSFLPEKLKSCHLSLSPYSQFAIDFNKQKQLSGLINKSLLKNAVSEFHKIEPVQSILNFPVMGLNQIGEKDLYKAVHQVKTQILHSGVDNIPDDIRDILLLQNKDPNTIFARFILYLISVYSILEVCDQLIYQSVLNDNLLVINEDNIISIGPEINHALGTGYEIGCQPNSNMFFNSINTIVLMDFEIHGRKYHKMCRVDGTNLSFSQDEGDVIKMKLRELDNNLNPYFKIS